MIQFQFIFQNRVMLSRFYKSCQLDTIYS